MNLLIIAICITATFASNYSLLEHYDWLTVHNNECLPLFYGPYCNIPYCIPENGVIVQNEFDRRYYHCSCSRNKDYISGAHCEIIDCNEGTMSNSTFQCECPGHTVGDFCQWNLRNIRNYCIWSLLLLIAILLRFCLPRCLERIRQNPDSPDYLKRFERFCTAVYEFMSKLLSNCQGSDTSQTVQPEVQVVERVVERVVYRDRVVEPPAYDPAGIPGHPPSYESAISQP